MLPGTNVSGSLEVAVVTGASSGLGRSIAIRLAKENYHLVLASRNEEKLHSLKLEISNDGGESTVIPTDVSSESSVDNLVEKAEEIGTVSVVINNSGLGLFSNISDHPIEDFDRQINVNLRGSFLVSRGFIPEMKNNQAGKLVFINSVAGKWGYPFSAGYVASKFGLTGLANSLRNELREDNIKVISVFPGAIDSPFWDVVNVNFPREEMMTSEDVAETVVHSLMIPGISVLEEIVIRRVQGDL